MTQKDYNAIAAIIKDNTTPLNSFGRKTLANYVQERICKQLADYFVADNDQFDREKFLKACGLF